MIDLQSMPVVKRKILILNPSLSESRNELRQSRSWRWRRSNFVVNKSKRRKRKRGMEWSEVKMKTYKM